MRLLQKRDRLNLVKYGWEQGMEPAIVAHDTREQEGAIMMSLMNRQHDIVLCDSVGEKILVCSCT